MEKVLESAISSIENYIGKRYSGTVLSTIRNEINILVGENCSTFNSEQDFSYEELQAYLARVNEKETIRKVKGVYYTPTDVAEFIVNNVKKLYLSNVALRCLNGITDKKSNKEHFCNAIVYDPTCGAGEFLLACLMVKLNDGCNPLKAVKTICGNDLNIVSVRITQLRIILAILECDAKVSVKGISKILLNNFTCDDYLKHDLSKKYDIIIGNPPYVEDSQYDGELTNKYGNIYANVLSNSNKQLKDNGVMGFVIPLSYISTPRMQTIRDELSSDLSHQYILSYSDRPDCLFQSVHQKLNIIIAKKDGVKHLATGGYTYWYKTERQDLFVSPSIVSNPYENAYIPKLGNILERNIYKKVISQNITLSDMLGGKGPSVYLNMRATFWIKAFRNKHLGSEYKCFRCKNKNDAALAMCVLNSSLFWWYWVVVSDCWHITSKELNGFTIPTICDKRIGHLAESLEKELEKTKEYVGTKQTEYEYKHKACIDTIHRIDDLICKYYGLTKQETEFIKNFAYIYRVSGGLNVKGN